ncbi:hypothetical protein NQZ68_034398 [Dissostichus eleginoides]|nr:hypothetical protein NQZ68_034398 [Dissostichus eleginoides]
MQERKDLKSDRDKKMVDWGVRGENIKARGCKIGNHKTLFYSTSVKSGFTNVLKSRNISTKKVIRPESLNMGFPCHIHREEIHMSSFCTSDAAAPHREEERRRGGKETHLKPQVLIREEFIEQLACTFRWKHLLVAAGHEVFEQKCRLI